MPALCERWLACTCSALLLSERLTMSFRPSGLSNAALALSWPRPRAALPELSRPMLPRMRSRSDMGSRSMTTRVVSGCAPGSSRVLTRWLGSRFICSRPCSSACTSSTSPSDTGKALRHVPHAPHAPVGLPLSARAMLSTRPTLTCNSSIPEARLCCGRLTCEVAWPASCSCLFSATVMTFRPCTPRSVA